MLIMLFVSIYINIMNRLIHNETELQTICISLNKNFKAMKSLYSEAIAFTYTLQIQNTMIIKKSNEYIK